MGFTCVYSLFRFLFLFCSGVYTNYPPGVLRAIDIHLATFDVYLTSPKTPRGPDPRCFLHPKQRIE